MPLVGTTIFTDPDGFRTSLQGSKIEFVFTDGGNFSARATSLELPNLRLLYTQEHLSRIAFISLAPEQAFISLPMRFDAPPIFDGIKLKLGDIIFHGIGDRVHLRTKGKSDWAFISSAPTYLAKFGKILTGADLVPPPGGRILRPAANAATSLRATIAKASRIAKTRAEVITHRECVRSIEQELLHALIACLTADDALANNARRHHVSIMARFEAVLSAHPDRQLRMGVLCKAIGTPERTLRVCCAEVLGMGPSRYGRLRRLNLARSALAHRNATKLKVAEAAARYGFSEPGRFAVVYRSVFGESPSTTLWRSGTAAQRQFAEYA